MRENIRLYATLAIWFAFMAMTIVIFVASDVVSDANPNTAVFIALILALAASVSTASIWLSGIFGSRQPTASRASDVQMKKKRVSRDRLERLVDGLNADELDELETLLIARDEIDQQQWHQE